MTWHLHNHDTFIIMTWQIWRFFYACLWQLSLSVIRSVMSFLMQRWQTLSLPLTLDHNKDISNNVISGLTEGSSAWCVVTGACFSLLVRTWRWWVRATGWRDWRSSPSIRYECRRSIDTGLDSLTQTRSSPRSQTVRLVQQLRKIVLTSQTHVNDTTNP